MIEHYAYHLTLDEWKRVRDVLWAKWDGCPIVEGIDEMIAEAENGMTDDDETVMIAVPVRWAKHEADMATHERNDADWNKVANACREALAARKTKYERWRKETLLAWEHVEDHLTDDRWGEPAAKLMSAAPQLLDALDTSRHPRPSAPPSPKTGCHSCRLTTLASTRSVADEVLGGKKHDSPIPSHYALHLTLDEWQRVRDALGHHWGEGPIWSAIGELIAEGKRQ